MKTLIGSAPYLEREGGLRGLEYIFYSFPFVCDYDCIDCYSAGRIQPEDKLSEKEIGSIIEDTANLGIRVFGTMGLGEPTISQGFEASVKAAHNFGLIPYIFTNAFNLDKRMADMLAGNGASLIIHIDALNNDDYHNLCRGRSDLNTTLHNLEYARTQFLTDEKSDTRIGVNMVVRKQNIGAIAEIADYCENSGFAFVLNTLLETGLGYVSQDDFPINTVPLGTASDGICEYLRRGIAIQGRKIMVCPYSDIVVANIREGLNSDKTGWDYAKEFFAQNGPSRCIVRHPDYEN